MTFANSRKFRRHHRLIGRREHERASAGQMLVHTRKSIGPQRAVRALASHVVDHDEIALVLEEFGEFHLHAAAGVGERVVLDRRRLRGRTKRYQPSDLSLFRRRTVARRRRPVKDDACL